MRFLFTLAGLWLMAGGAFAEQAVTAGKLLADGFEVRASYQIEKGATVLVLQKGAEAYLCSLIVSDAWMAFSLANVGKVARPLPALPTVCAPIK